MNGLPPGTPYLEHPEPVVTPIDPDDLLLCPACGHATLFRFRTVVLHDDGVVDCGTTTACGHPECPDEG